MLPLALLFLVAFLIYFLPGYLLLCGVRGLSGAERVGASFGVSFLLLGLIELAVYGTGLPQGPLNAMALAALLSILGAFWWSRGRLWPGREGGCLLGGFALFCLHLLLLACVLPIFNDLWFFDWIEYYHRTLFYLNRLPLDTRYWTASVPARQPLFSLDGAFFLSLIGAERPGVAPLPLDPGHPTVGSSPRVVGSPFAFFQVAVVFQNGAFFLAAYLLAARFFGRRAAVGIGLLLFLNFGLLYHAVYTWPKLQSAYFSLLAVYFYLRLWDFWNPSGPPDGKGPGFKGAAIAAGLLAGLFAGGGYLAQQTGAAFLAGLLAHAAAAGLRRKTRLPAALLFAGAILALFPWHGWAVATYGFEKVFLDTPAALFLKRPPREAAWRLKHRTLEGCFLPTSSQEDRFTARPAAPDPRLLLYAEWHYNGVTGALTISLALFLLASILSGNLPERRSARGPPAAPPARRRISTEGLLVLLCLLQFSLPFVILGFAFSSGIVHAAFAQPMVVVFLFSACLLLRSPGPLRVSVAMFLLADFFFHLWGFVLPDLRSFLAFAGFPEAGNALPELRSLLSWGGMGGIGNIQQKADHQVLFLYDLFSAPRPGQPGGWIPWIKGALLGLELAAAVALLRFVARPATPETPPLEPPVIPDSPHEDRGNPDSEAPPQTDENRRENSELDFTTETQRSNTEENRRDHGERKNEIFPNSSSL